MQTEVPFDWQRARWSQLVTAIDRDRLPHALLFAGPAGVGKQLMAEALVRLLLCRDPVEGQACHQCKGCRLAESKAHPDVRFLSPEQAGGAIRVEQVRELTEFLQGSAQLAGRKAAVVSPADALNTNAANALLKCIEEPAPERWVILVSARVGALPLTILSRCQRVMVTPPSAEQARAFVRAEVQAGDDLDLALELGDAPLHVLELIQSGRIGHYRAWRKVLARCAIGQADPLEVAAFEPAVPLVDLVAWWLRLNSAAVRAAVRADSQTRGISRRPLGDPRALLEHRDALEAAHRWLTRHGRPNRSMLLHKLALHWREAFASTA
ncbi:MAG: DNA polymerase III subunit delta' [Pseudomonadota bacterium]|nr:DNA polymerase III subunit delta' [Pseudomonadota bacterium]